MTAPAQPIVVRDARPDEYDEIADLTWAAYREYARKMTPDAWDGLEQSVRSGLAATEPVERIVAERDGRIVGSVQLYPAAANAYNGAIGSSGCPEVRLLAVDPAARGSGIATALMEECIERARRAGATELGLHTSESMQTAIQMYERMGFVRYPADDFHPPGAEVVTAYRRKLAAPDEDAQPSSAEERA